MDNWSLVKIFLRLGLHQVSLSLQDRLGLAKVKYERKHGLSTDPLDGSEGYSVGGKQPSSAFSNGYRCFGTPSTSTPITSPILTKDLPRSARSKNAAMFDLKSMEAMTSGRRKRRRENPLTTHSAKHARISRNYSDVVHASSPTTGRQRPSVLVHTASFVSQSDTIPDESLYVEKLSSHNIDPELPTSASLLSSSPPRTPPPRRSRLPNDSHNQDGVDLLMYLANSPTPVTFGDKGRASEFLPSTPPTQHGFLPSLMSTPGGGLGLNFSTPGQPFNFADFVNVTPSPAQRQWANRTPRVLSKTPIGAKDVRKRLNFDTLAPPAASPNPKSPEQKVGLALHLGEELRF